MLSLIVPPSIGINTLYFRKKLQKSYIISFFIGTYISFIYLIKSSLIQYYSIVLLYSLSLQYAIQYNKNPFRSCCLAFTKLIILVFYISRLISFLYFFRQVNAIVGVELIGCRTLKVGRIFGFIGSYRFTVKRQAI